MLIKFTVENYRSFAKAQSLDMTAGPVRAHPGQAVDFGDIRVLTSAMVFGANASGKTNLVRAVNDSRLMVVQGMPVAPGNYCRTSPGAVSRTTGFEYVIRIGDKVYSYGFEVLLSDGMVSKEWLRILTPSGSRDVFSRDGDEILPGSRLNSDESKIFDVYGAEVRSSGGLLLRALSRTELSPSGNLHHAKVVMDWFVNKLVVLFPGSVRTAETGSDLELLSRMMSAYGTGVSEVVFEKVDDDRLRLEGDFGRLGSGAVINIRSDTDLFRVRNVGGGQEVDRVMFRHGDASFDFGDESDGTKRLFDLAPFLNPDSGEDMTYVIDEMDRSLHPQLTKRFVKDFLEIAGATRRQLVATVHESRLMDLNLLRRDEIWLVEMGPDGSEMYSLEDFNERGDRRVDRSYMEGRYGGVPFFSALFPDMED